MLPSAAAFVAGVEALGIAPREAGGPGSSALNCAATSVGTPALRPLSAAAFLTHSCSVCVAQPIFAAIDITAAQREA